MRHQRDLPVDVTPKVELHRLALLQNRARAVLGELWQTWLFTLTHVGNATPFSILFPSLSFLL